nr:hypothetical protein GCM10020185_77880 [Pseudomonas brassicacearum subsp. brassicacearum]
MSTTNIPIRLIGGTVFTNGHPADIDYDKRLDEPWAKSVGIRETATARFEYELSEDWKNSRDLWLEQ